MKELVEKQNKLQEEAFETLEQLGLEKLLTPFGEFKFVGSIEYGLMTWRDIDADLFVKNVPSDELYWQIVQTIFCQPEVELLMLADNRNGDTEPNRPKSMYLGIKYLNAHGNKWRFDIRILRKEDDMTNKVKTMIEQKIDEQKRLAILEIKSQVHDNPKYHKEFSSVDIYEAVLLHGIKTLADFKKYLLKNKNVRTQI